MKYPSAKSPKLKASSRSVVESVEVTDRLLSGFIGYNLKRVVNTMQADLSYELVKFDLRIITFSALTMIVENPGMRQSQLAEALNIERSNLVLVIDELDSRELITRNVVAGDRRSYALKATLAGVRLSKISLAAVAVHEARLLANLSAGEKNEILQSLMKLRLSQVDVAK